ncbi:MAG: hypothetical protein JWN32_2335 [Solirubrobacterales bacterium]|nr:hypothetical protein [Solirubrobacterales bacterium]
MAFPRRWLTGRWLTLATGLGAALPVVVSTTRALVDGWAPISDQGTIAMRAYDVLGAHTPLLGQYSLASSVTGHPTYSPGPMLYWLLALPARFGTAATLPLTMGLVNTGAVVGIVALARRRGGMPLMFAAAAAVALMSRSFSSESLHAIFNPAAALFPFTLLIFLCWSLACGDRRLLPLIVVVASFVVQCHLTYVAPTAGLLALGIGGAVAARGPGPSLRRWALVALGVGAVCWAPPVVQELSHTPGNLGLLARAATTSKKTEGATAAARAVVRVVGIPPRWLRAPVTAADQASLYSGGDYGDTRLADVAKAPGALAIASCCLLLAAVVAVGVAGARRRRAEIAGAAAISVVLCAAFAVVVATTPTNESTTLGYSTWWGSAAGMWVWLSVGWSAASLVRVLPRLAELRVPAFAPALGVGVVALAASAVAAAESPDTHAPDYRPVRTITARVERATRGARLVRLVQRSFVARAYGPAIRYALHVRGIGVIARPGAAKPGVRYDHVVTVYETGPRPHGHSAVLAHIRLRDGSGDHRLTVTVSRRRRRGRV